MRLYSPVIADDSSGCIELYNHTNWGMLCTNNFTFAHANAVCRTLGFQTAVNFSTCSNPSPYLPYWSFDMSCSNTAQSVTDCIYSYTYPCNNYTVECQVEGSGHIRLAGGKNSSEGRVEIFHSKRWRTLCSNYFTINDGFVVCHQLGFSGIDEIVDGTVFGSGNLTIDVQCTGNEERLTDCTFHTPMSNKCKVVGVICSKLD